RFLPKLTSNFDGIDACGLPPGAFVAGAMRGPVMHAAKRDREFIARLAGQGARLHVAQMMRIGWLAATNEARLPHDIAKVLAAAIAPRGRKREHALVYTPGLTSDCVFGGDCILQPSNSRHRIRVVRGYSRIG